MGRIFKTPGDDAVEETLRSMHTQNMLDTGYERAMGWGKAILFSVLTMFITSAIEYKTGASMWNNTVEWLKDWIMEKVSG